VTPFLALAAAPPSLRAAATEQSVAAVLVPVLVVLGAVALGYVLATVITVAVRRLARHSDVAAHLSRRARRPLRATLLVVAAWVGIAASTDRASGWRSPVEHVLLIALIVTLTWLTGSLAFVLEDFALGRYRVDVEDNQHARRVRTQIQVLRRLTVALLVIVGIASVLLTFPEARALSTSIFASAGLLSIVAGLAAQSSLANVFAGMQLAFTNAIRVDDVVIADGQWGRIEEITLTYVVVHIWDDRRLLLPSTYFTTTPFENWTRHASQLLGTVELDVDWHVPIERMRVEQTRLLRASDLWDGRVDVLQVTDATGGAVRLRALASAVDAPTLWDLRCYLREGLVAWMQSEAPEGLTRTRWERTGGAAPAVPAPPAKEARLFSGSSDADARSHAFAGPAPEQTPPTEASTTAPPATGGSTTAISLSAPVIIGPGAAIRHTPHEKPAAGTSALTERIDLT
jgi:small-conductance mechanosensitive channel